MSPRKKKDDHQDLEGDAGSQTEQDVAGNEDQDHRDTDQNDADEAEREEDPENTDELQLGGCRFEILKVDGQVHWMLYDADGQPIATNPEPLPSIGAARSAIKSVRAANEAATVRL